MENPAGSNQNQCFAKPLSLIFRYHSSTMDPAPVLWSIAEAANNGLLQKQRVFTFIFLATLSLQHRRSTCLHLYRAVTRSRLPDVDVVPPLELEPRLPVSLLGEGGQTGGSSKSGLPD